jgi:hypothetical protein
MRKFLAVGAAALLTLAITVPLATAATTTAPKTVTGSFLATFTGGDGTPTMVRIEVRTDASGAVQFGYYEQDNLKDSNDSSVAVVDSVQFFRDSSGAKGARLRLTECSPAYVDPEDGGPCNDQAVVTITDGTPDTFFGGTPTDPYAFPFTVLDGNIAISATTGQNGQ